MTTLKSVEMKAISKSFSGVNVLNHVNFDLNPGEVVALMGENGAGKSTLMKILSGVYSKDEGQIYIKGEAQEIQNPRKAYDLGIRVVHQELSLVDHLTVAENIFLGQEPSKMGFINKKKMKEECQDILNRDGFALHAGDRVGSLSIANKQLVEIAKATQGRTDILILDEPTSALTDTEIRQLFTIIRALRNKGVSIIYISHKLEEIVEISDRIVVLKDGQNSGEAPAEGITQERIVEMMVGRDVQYEYKENPNRTDEIILSVDHVSNDQISDVSFQLKKGEILGVAGLMGSGRTELLETLFGERKMDKGDLFLNGKKIKNKTPVDAIQHGFALVTEDRKGNGVILEMSVKKNNSLPNLKDFLTFGMIQEKKRSQSARDSINRFKVKTSSMNQKITNLSGGNQQKIVLSKWLNTNPLILMVDEPTRGIDVGAKSEIYQLLRDLTAEGISMIVVSSELPEIIALSERVMVMNEGKVMGILNREEVSEEAIMMLATEGDKR